MYLVFRIKEFEKRKNTAENKQNNTLTFFSSSLIPNEKTAKSLVTMSFLKSIPMITVSELPLSLVNDSTASRASFNSKKS